MASVLEAWTDSRFSGLHSTVCSLEYSWPPGARLYYVKDVPGFKHYGFMTWLLVGQFLKPVHYKVPFVCTLKLTLFTVCDFGHNVYVFGWAVYGGISKAWSSLLEFTNMSRISNKVASCGALKFTSWNAVGDWKLKINKVLNDYKHSLYSGDTSQTFRLSKD